MARGMLRLFARTRISAKVECRAYILAAAALCVPLSAQAQSCPPPLAAATKLVLVIADKVVSTTGHLQRFERTSVGAPWRAVGGPQTALLGYKGVAWAHGFREFARDHEPIKVDGDRRVPAGAFKIGNSFGFAASARPGYLHIVDGTVCVDDARSPAYNTITTRAKLGWRVHGENMWRIPEYETGLLVDYPTNAEARAGSCIFIHRWIKGATGTHGCVALPEAGIASLQDFAQGGAVLAVLPRQALPRFKGCLPD
jgi:L,D-peptidoglycan transpeptidase YkuD (ErfK/YbiS/YcfS/YnhG family)